MEGLLSRRLKEYIRDQLSHYLDFGNAKENFEVSLFGKNSIAHVIIRDSSIRVFEVNELLRCSSPGIPIILESINNDDNRIGTIKLNFPMSFWSIFSKPDEAFNHGEKEKGFNSFENCTFDGASDGSFDDESTCSIEKNKTSLTSSSRSQVSIDDVKLRLRYDTSNESSNGDLNGVTSRSWVSLCTSNIISRILSSLQVTVTNLNVNFIFPLMKDNEKKVYSILFQSEKLVMSNPTSNTTKSNRASNGETILINGSKELKLLYVKDFSLSCGHFDCSLSNFSPRDKYEYCYSSFLPPTSVELEIAYTDDQLMVGIEFQEHILINFGAIVLFLSEVNLFNKRNIARSESNGREVGIVVHVKIPRLCNLFFENNAEVFHNMKSSMLIDLMNVYFNWCSEIDRNSIIKLFETPIESNICAFCSTGVELHLRTSGGNLTQMGLSISTFHVFAQNNCIASLSVGNELDISQDSAPNSVTPLKLGIIMGVESFEEQSIMRFIFPPKVHFNLQSDGILSLLKSLNSAFKHILYQNNSYVSGNTETLFSIDCSFPEGFHISVPSKEENISCLTILNESCRFRYNFSNEMDQLFRDQFNNDYSMVNKTDDVLFVHGLQSIIITKNSGYLYIFDNSLDVHVSKGNMISVDEVFMSLSEKRIRGALSILPTIKAIFSFVSLRQDTTVGADSVDKKSTKSDRFSISCSAFRLKIVSDEKAPKSLYVHKEHLIEEALCDFLSQVSCYSAIYDARQNNCKAARVSSRFCRHRLEAAGLEAEIADRMIDLACTLLVRQVNFLLKGVSFEDSHENGDGSSSTFEREHEKEDPMSNKDHLSCSDGVSFIEFNSLGLSAADVTAVMTSVVEEIMKALVVDENILFAENDEQILQLNNEQVLRVVPVPLHSCGDIILDLQEIYMTLNSGLDVFWLELGSLHVRNGCGTELLSIENSSCSANSQSSSNQDPSYEYRKIRSSIHTTKPHLNQYRENQQRVGIELQKSIIVSYNDSLSSSVKSFFDNVSITIVPRDFEESLKRLSLLTSPMSSSVEQSNVDEKSESQIPPFTCLIESTTLYLASDEISPFVQIEFDYSTLNCSFDYDILCNDKVFITNFSSLAIRIFDLSPPATGIPPGLYENILVPSHIDATLEQKPMLELSFKSYSSMFKNPSRVNITVRYAQILFLQKFFMGELLQYYTEKLCPLVIFDEIVDDSGNPLPPIQYCIEIEGEETAILIPKDSTSFGGMCGMKFDRILIKNSYVKKSWSIPDAEGHCHNFYESLSNDDSSEGEEFFDALDCEAVGKSTTERSDSFIENSSFSVYSRQDIEQVQVNMKKVHIFLAPMPSDSEFHDERIDGSCVISIAHVEPNEPAFSCPCHSEAVAERFPLWEEITTSQKDGMSLQMTIDKSPNQRIFITNTEEQDDASQPSDMKLKLYLNQFHLLLSIWYCNMQELPILFPYSENFVKENACLPNIDITYKYDSTDWSTYVGEGNTKKCDIVVCFKNIEWICLFDSEYIVNKRSPELLHGVTISASNIVVTLGIHSDGLIFGSGSSCQLRLETMRSDSNDDDVKEADPYMSKYIVGSLAKSDGRIWTDPNWGFQNRVNDRNINFSTLSFPFQFSVVLTVDNWCGLNVGFQDPVAEMGDLTLLWVVLDYFSLYFKDKRFGHPAFAYESLHENSNQQQPQCMNLDIKVWFESLRLNIPNLNDKHSLDGLKKRKYVSIFSPKDAGLFYRYTSVGMAFTNQEICAKGLGAAVVSTTVLSNGDVNHVQSFNEKDVIFSNLTFLLRYGFDSDSNHMTFSCKSPLPDEYFLGYQMDGKQKNYRVDISPVFLRQPFVLNYQEHLKRDLGLSCLQINLDSESLHCFIICISNLLFGPYENISTTVINGELDESFHSEKSGNESFTDCNTFTSDITFDLSDVKIIICDPVLRLHRPNLVICFQLIKLTTLDFQALNTSKSIRSSHSETVLQYVCEVQGFVDYFNNSLKCWEPFVEPFEIRTLLESNSSRGDGVVVQSNTPIYFNVTYGLLETLDEAITTYLAHVIPDEDMIKCTVDNGKSNISESLPKQYIDFGENTRTSHSKKRLLNECDRVAFSLKNESGELVRYHQRSSHCQSRLLDLFYVENGERVQLDFEPIETVVMNLAVVERPITFSGSTTVPVDTRRSGHKIDVQIAGYNFIPNISIDKLGSWWRSLVPVSSDLQSKINEDWKIKNIAGNILVEVTPINGGRQVSLRSLFKVKNLTSHNINLSLNAGPTPSNTTVNRLGYGESYDVPLSFLSKSLQNSEDSLGNLSLGPNLSDGKTREYLNSILSPETYKVTLEESWSKKTNKCSIDLISLVNNSDLMYKKRENFKKFPRTGTSFSCHIVSNENTSIPPFCYIVEIRRKIVASESDQFRESKQEKIQKEKVENDRSERLTSSQHPPISYTLVIHPPIIIENFLPKMGKFSLFNGRNEVVWSSVMKPGQKVPIHTVGLDELIYLHIEIGQCQTPHGEYALVHDGVDSALSYQSNSSQENYTDYIMSLKSPLLQFKNVVYDTPEVRGRAALVETFSPKRLARAKMSKEVLSHSDMNERVFGSDDTVSDKIIINDPVGQTLHLKIENTRGGGGQRKITIFCPYWILNSTPYRLLYQDDSRRDFVCGTVDPGNNERSLIRENDLSCRESDSINEDVVRVWRAIERRGTVLNGTSGVLASVSRNELIASQVSLLLGEDLPMQYLSKACFMFNFSDESGKRLTVRLVDSRNPRTKSNFSRSFIVEGIVLTQSVSMYCSNGRVLEISVSVNAAPGVLEPYTKIVRFSPKFVAINQLERPIRLWQDSSFSHRNFVTVESEVPVVLDDHLAQFEYLFGKNSDNSRRITSNPYVKKYHMPTGTLVHPSANFIATLSPSGVVPFFLPDTTSERHLRIDFGPTWHPTASFPIDTASGHFPLKVACVREPSSLEHVETRSIPEFELSFPPNPGPGRTLNWDAGEKGIGIWFEAESESGHILVKGTKRGSICEKETDVHVGDELLSVDGESVSGKRFEEVINDIKNKIQLVSNSFQQTKPRMGKPRNTFYETPQATFTLKFRTAEERLRLLRTNALNRGSNTYHVEQIESPLLFHERVNDEMISVQLKLIGPSVFLFVRPFDFENPNYRISNKSFSHGVCFRQRFCYGHSWTYLEPGETCSYAWEEPLKQRKLTIRVYSPNLTAENYGLRKTSHFSVQEETHSIFGQSRYIDLDKIGEVGILSCPDHDKDGNDLKLTYEIETEGATRVLTITSGDFTSLQQPDNYDAIKEKEDELKHQSLNSINESIQKIEHIRSHLNRIHENDHTYLKNQLLDIGKNSLISTPNQMLVEVLECRGLHAADLSGLSNPFCEIYLKSRSPRDNFRMGRTKKKRTYFVENTLAPSWYGQSFVLDIPKDAVECARNYYIRINVKSFSTFSRHFLGKADIELVNLKDQEFISGWFSLTSKSTGKSALNINSATDQLRGSIKVKIQWIYTNTALINYYHTVLNQYLTKLHDQKSRMEEEIRKPTIDIKRHLNRNRKARTTLIHRSRQNELHGQTENYAGIRSKIFHLWNIQREASRQIRWKTVHASPNGSNNLIVSSTHSEERTPISLRKGLDSRSRIRTFSEEGLMFHLSPFSTNRQRSFTAPTSQWMHSTFEDDGMHDFKSSFRDILNRINSGQSIEETALTQSEMKEMMDEEAIVFDHLHRKLGLLYHKAGEYFHLRHLHWSSNPSRLVSWVQAGIEIKNGRKVKDLPHQESREIFDGEGQNFWSRIIKPPVNAPSLLKEIYNSHTQRLARSKKISNSTAERSFRSVICSGGTLSIKPITALHIRSISKGKATMYVKVKYGSQIRKSHTVHDYLGSPDWSIDPNSNKTSRKFNDSTIDLKFGDENFDHQTEISGALTISIVEKRHGIGADEPLGSVIFPIKSVVENCLNCDHNTMIKWFPLTENLASSLLADIPLKDVQRENDTNDDFVRSFSPCIRLEIRWKPRLKDEKTIFDGPKKYPLSSSSFLGRISSFQVTYFKADFSGIIVSCIDSLRSTELFAIVLNEIDCKYCASVSRTNTGLVIGKIQVDNGLLDTIEPVILADSYPFANPSPVLIFKSEKDNMRSKKNVDSFSLVHFQMKELDIRIDDSWLKNVWRFFAELNYLYGTKFNVPSKGFAYTNEMNQRHDDEFVACSNSQFLSNLEVDRTSFPSLFDSVLHEQPTYAKKVFIESLEIGELAINLSFQKKFRSRGAGINNALDNNDTRDFEDSLTYDQLNSIGLHRLGDINLVEPKLEKIPSISDAPIRIKFRDSLNVFDTIENIITSHKEVLWNDLFNQIYIIIGSVDTLGNPTTLAKTIGTGVRDFFYLPSMTFLETPTDPTRIGLGVVKGTLSLVSHSAQGVFGITSNLGSAVGQVAARISMDEKLRERQAEKDIANKKRRMSKKEALLITVQPFEDIAKGVFTGFTGIFVEPYRSLKNREGLVGFTRGVAKGLVGSVAHPIVGLGNAFSHVSSSVQMLAGGINIISEEDMGEVEKWKYPCLFSIGNRIVPFDPTESQSFSLLFYLSKKLLYSHGNEYVLLAEQIQHNEICMITNFRIVLIVKNEGTRSYHIKWQVEFDSNEVTCNLNEDGHHIVKLVIYFKPISLARESRFSSSLKASFEMKGNFQLREKFVRIHNLIHCINQHFNKLILESSSEQKGIFSFRNLIFQDLTQSYQSEDNPISCIFIDELLRQMNKLQWCYPEYINTQIDLFCSRDNLSTSSAQKTREDMKSEQESHIYSIRSDLLLEEEQDDLLIRRKSCLPTDHDRAVDDACLNVNGDGFKESLVLMLKQILKNTETLSSLHENSIQLLPTSSNTGLDTLTTETSQTLIDNLRQEVSELKTQLAALKQLAEAPVSEVNSDRESSDSEVLSIVPTTKSVENIPAFCCSCFPWFFQKEQNEVSDENSYNNTHLQLQLDAGSVTNQGTNLPNNPGEPVPDMSDTRQPSKSWLSLTKANVQSDTLDDKDDKINYRWLRISHSW